MLAENHYHDRGFDIDATKLMPGEFFVTDEDRLLVTVLGSCVAACIRDRATGIGGMNHFMLPDSDPVKEGRFGPSARYGTHAMEVLINGLLKLGANRSLLEAKVFGGGNVLPGMKAVNIGQRNADFVLRFLQTEEIKVVAQDLVDIHPRKVYYFPRSGKVMVKKLRTVHNDTVLLREQEYGSRIQVARASGETELFG